MKRKVIQYLLILTVGFFFGAVMTNSIFAQKNDNNNKKIEEKLDKIMKKLDKISETQKVILKNVKQIKYRVN